MKFFSKNIKALRKEHSLTQSALSDILGITHQQVANYESGKSNVSPEILNKLSSKFQISIDKILNFDLSKFYTEIASERLSNKEKVPENVNSEKYSSDELILNEPETSYGKRLNPHKVISDCMQHLPESLQDSLARIEEYVYQLEQAQHESEKEITELLRKIVQLQEGKNTNKG